MYTGINFLFDIIGVSKLHLHIINLNTERYLSEFKQKNVYKI